MKNQLKKNWYVYLMALVILGINIGMIVTQKNPEMSTNPVKVGVITIYQFVYFTLQQWVEPLFVIGIIVSIMVSVSKQEKGCVWHGKVCPWVISGMMVILVSVGFCVLWVGGVFKGIVESLLKWEFFLWAWLGMSGLVSYGWPKMKKSSGKKSEAAFYKKKIWVYGILFLLLLIPIFMLSPSVFAHADDYEYGYKAHLAWMGTHSLLEVLKAGVSIVVEFFFKWQGTFSSIFMMALHPGVIKEELYHIVPFFFLCIISGSVYFFFRTLLQEWLKVDKLYSRVLMIMYLLLVIQCMPYAYSAFFWYNGAVHYMAAHCVFLCFLTFLLRLKLGKTVWSNMLGAILTGIYVGGGNLVSGVEALFVVGTIFLVILISKKWKENVPVMTACVAFVGAFALNVAAPGNFTRIEISQGYGLFQAVLIAFAKTVQYALGEWIRWELIVFLLLCIPVLWKIAGKIEFHFPMPLIVIGYSWCYLSAMFFAPLYTITVVTVGRFQNIMFLTYVIWLLVDITYVLGWLQRRYDLKAEELIGSPKRYYYLVEVACILMCILSLAVEPQKYTFGYALQTIRSGEAKAYKEIHEHNIAVLRENTEKTVVLKPINQPPQLLDSDESETWYYGMRAFYGIDEIIFEE